MHFEVRPAKIIFTCTATRTILVYLILEISRLSSEENIEDLSTSDHDVESSALKLFYQYSDFITIRINYHVNKYYIYCLELLSVTYETEGPKDLKGKVSTFCRIYFVKGPQHLILFHLRQLIL